MAGEAAPVSDWLLPQVYRDLISVVGRDHTFALCGHALASGVRRKGRGLVGYLYVPVHRWAPTFRVYSELIGEEAASFLVADFAGTQLEICEPGSWLDAHRNRAILRTWKEEAWISTERVGWIHGITGRQVRNIVRGIQRAA
ncbi:hypothetical protein [Xanthomonas phaseoli]|uniref:hypothetical protein n=1 Tax=Xanthomonas phaseoli TaxID=1985254 RepID=UPI001F44136E|nr:hypothetical protein [Xanthomonas phaseoli]